MFTKMSLGNFRPPAFLIFALTPHTYLLWINYWFSAARISDSTSFFHHSLSFCHHAFDAFHVTAQTLMTLLKVRS